ncbi:hypothetical protein [Promicromonospora panici]|uniref:hypothetical protein n=1 Tax=Promicromonospora panici TaxID=2219658 RepID=UPI00101CCEE6|nr:hypothetical protein [Promicromonospora panici]
MSAGADGTGAASEGAASVGADGTRASSAGSAGRNQVRAERRRAALTERTLQHPVAPGRTTPGWSTSSTSCIAPWRAEP